MKNKYLWSVLPVIVLIVAVAMFLPKPIDTDLEKIGNGQGSVVFIYDPNLVVSTQQASEMKSAMERIGDRANFLLVRAGDPTTDDFKQQYQTRSADLLFFNGDGELFGRDVAVVPADVLIERITD